VHNYDRKVDVYIVETLNLDCHDILLLVFQAGECSRSIGSAGYKDANLIAFQMSKLNQRHCCGILTLCLMR
jgi:hypothetical protein